MSQVWSEIVMSQGKVTPVLDYVCNDSVRDIAVMTVWIFVWCVFNKIVCGKSLFITDSSAQHWLYFRLTSKLLILWNIRMGYLSLPVWKIWLFVCGRKSLWAIKSVLSQDLKVLWLLGWSVVIKIILKIVSPVSMKSKVLFRWVRYCWNKHKSIDVLLTFNPNHLCYFYACL